LKDGIGIKKSKDHEITKGKKNELNARVWANLFLGK
jgi:hypothetical protein